jgi:hypothetical protein
VRYGRSVLACAAALLAASVTSHAGGRAPEPAAGGTAFQARHVYFGNLHSHTSYSDGSGTPAQAYRHAREVAGLDFLAVTEHNHAQAESGADDRVDGLLIATNPSLYTGPQASGLLPAARRHTEDGRFVALYGQEFSSISQGNHVNVYDVDQVIDVPNGRFDRLVTWLAAHPDGAGNPPVIQLNHPALYDQEAKEYGADDFASRAAWLAAVGRHAALIEVINGPAMARQGGRRPEEVMEEDYLDYLNRGFRLAPTADQDNHYFTWGSTTDARTAVIAPALTKAALLEALRARHVYASEDRNLALVFEVNGRLQGDVVAQPPAVGSALDIRYTVRDPDEPGAEYEVHVFSDEDGPGGQVAQLVDAYTVTGDTPPGQTYTIPGVRYRRPGQYVFFRVVQMAEHGPNDRAWTAPVWLGGADGGGPPPPAPGAGVRIARLLPNAPGDEHQAEEVTLRNDGPQAVSLAGWTLRDLSGGTWSLGALGTLAPGAEKTVRRAGQAMSLNNGGDTITLVNRAGAAVQSVTYPQMAEGQRFVVPPP